MAPRLPSRCLAVADAERFRNGHASAQTAYDCWRSRPGKRAPFRIASSISRLSRSPSLITKRGVGIMIDQRGTTPSAPVAVCFMASINAPSFVSLRKQRPRLASTAAPTPQTDANLRTLHRSSTNERSTLFKNAFSTTSETL